MLELGAEIGRITLAIAEAGPTIYGLEASTAMLGALQAKISQHTPEVQARVHKFAADMRSFELQERFALVIAPFRAFLHNVTEADGLSCLAALMVNPDFRGREAHDVHLGQRRRGETAVAISSGDSGSR